LNDLLVTKATGDQYMFSVQRSQLKLRVKALGLLVDPVAGADCVFDRVELTTDGDGIVQEPVDKATRRA
jgi:hypothetical protein